MNRFSGSSPVAKVYKIDDVELHTWFERGRALVELRSPNGETLLEIWDDEVFELVEDGFLDMRNLKQSAFDYAQEIGNIG